MPNDWDIRIRGIRRCAEAPKAPATNPMKTEDDSLSVRTDDTTLGKDETGVAGDEDARSEISEVSEAADPLEQLFMERQWLEERCEAEQSLTQPSAYAMRWGMSWDLCGLVSGLCLSSSGITPIFAASRQPPPAASRQPPPATCHLPPAACRLPPAAACRTGTQFKVQKTDVFLHIKTDHRAVLAPPRICDRYERAPALPGPAVRFHVSTTYQPAMSIAFYPGMTERDDKAKCVDIDQDAYYKRASESVLDAVSERSRHDADWCGTCRIWYYNSNQHCLIQVPINSSRQRKGAVRFGCAYLAFDSGGLLDWNTAIQMKNGSGPYAAAEQWVELQHDPDEDYFEVVWGSGRFWALALSEPDGDDEDEAADGFEPPMDPMVGGDAAAPPVHGHQAAMEE